MSLLELEHSSTILGQSIYQLNGSRSSFGSINPMNEPNPDLQKGGKKLDWPGSWVWEVGAALLSTFCVSLLVGFLAYVDGTTYGSWGYGVSSNAIVSTITTIAKFCILKQSIICAGFGYLAALTPRISNPSTAGAVVASQFHQTRSVQ